MLSVSYGKDALVAMGSMCGGFVIGNSSTSLYFALLTDEISVLSDF